MCPNFDIAVQPSILDPNVVTCIKRKKIVIKVLTFCYTIIQLHLSPHLKCMLIPSLPCILASTPMHMQK